MQTIVYVIGVILFVASIVIIWQASQNTDHLYSGIKATNGLAIDKEHIYGRKGDHLYKYNRKGVQVLSQKLDFKPIGGMLLVEDSLLLISKDHSIINLNSHTFDVQETLPLTETDILGKDIDWLDRRWDKWWVGNGKVILCYNDDLSLEGLWKLPSEIKLTRPTGVWVGKSLCMIGADSDHIYKLKLPERKVHSKITGSQKVGFKGPVLAISGGYFWGVDGESILRSKIEL